MAGSHGHNGHQELRVAVVGGSLGGLTAANLLHDLGCRVDVYERSENGLSGLGAGIVSHPMTLRYLHERRGLGVEALTTGSTWLRYLDDDGRVRFEQPCEYRFLSWQALYRRLRDAYEGPLHLGTAVDAVATNGAGAMVRLGDGTDHRYDLVVAADGVRSTTRARVAPDATFTYSGYVGWRGTVPLGDMSTATADALVDQVTYYVGDRTHILVYPIEDPASGPLMNFVWYRNVEAPELESMLTDIDGVIHSLSLPPGKARPEVVDELQSDAARLLPAPLAELVLLTREPFFQVIGDIEVPRMAFGRVLICGDAAFVARPHAAAGTAKAAADAWALAAAMGQDAPLSDVLEAWNERQTSVGAKLVARSRAIGERFQVSGTCVPGDPDLRFGLFGPGD